MAELIVNRKKRRSISPKIDLTPMVDLGFLLLSFFIVSTTLTKPKSLTINMPFDAPSRTAYSAQCAISILPFGDDSVVVYEGIFDQRHHEKRVPMSALRACIMDKQKRIMAQFGSTKSIEILIKPLQNARYGALVEVLDEMLLNDVRHYAIVDLSVGESKTYSNLIKQTGLN